MNIRVTNITFQQINPTGFSTPYRFNAKELDSESGLFYYGARYYHPMVSKWLGVDPLAADAPGWTPYNAMWNNPLRFVDLDGRWAVDHIDVTKNDDGTFTVVGGEANADKNIYVVDGSGQRTGEVVGEMLTEYSFHGEDGRAIVGAIINPRDNSGQTFMDNDIIKGNPGLFHYMRNATGGKKYDFKRNGTKPGDPNYNNPQYHYRGMSFNGKIASARDIGNYAAGYVAGVKGFSWGSSRLAFDALESYQKGGLATEGQPTQQAQRLGHNVGYSVYQQRKFEREWQKATNPWPPGPKY
jgi:RHS repeat-associated protein